MERRGSGGCGSGWQALMSESGPPDQVEPAAQLPEDLVVTAEAPAGLLGDGKQSGGLHGEVPVRSRPWMGWHRQCWGPGPEQTEVQH